MNANVTKLVAGAQILLLALLISAPLTAQVAGAALSGIITDPSGNVVPDARIFIRNLATGQSTESRTDSAGLYDVLNLSPGDYEVRVSKEGFGAKLATVTVTASAHQTMNLTLSGVVLSLEDLGFSSAQTQGNAQDQATLDKRSHMLKMHQRFGLLATVPLVATIFTGASAGGKSTSSTDRTLHAALGSVSLSLYCTSAYYAIFAPKIAGTQTRGPIRLHKALAWIHGIGMVLTPVLGALAYEQKSRGEKVHGIASAHGAVGIVTVAAYGASILSVSKKF